MRSRRGGAVALVASAAAAAATVLTATAPADAAAVAARSCPPARYGVHSAAPGTGRTVALTFDDGPGPSDAAILAVLKAERVRATFFDLGVAAAARPRAVQAQVNAGHAVGNHTWDHAQLPRLSTAGQAGEMDRASAAQAAVAGRLPCLFRPPYGSYDAATLALAQQRQMVVFTWSVDPEDWKAAGSASSAWVNRIVSLAEAGARQAHPVILLHDQAGGNPATVAALPRIIDFYRDRGYAFVDLTGRGGYSRGSPFGYYDRLTRTSSTVRVDGWAIDPDTVGPTQVDVYVDGHGVGRYRADGDRPDVARVYPRWGPRHGFAVTFGYRAPGEHHVCVYADNTVGSGDDTLLGCRAVWVPRPGGG